jgi:hypothetical protein
LTRGATRRKDLLRLCIAAIYIPKFEELDWQKRNILHAAYARRIYTQQLYILSVWRTTLSLKAEHLQRQLRKLLLG